IDTIEEMARRYLPHLLAASPCGAFRLAGYCHGGLAAWEIAHQLEEAGRPVERVGIIDTFSINTRAWIRAAAQALLAASGLAGGLALRERGMLSLWGLTRRLMQKDRSILTSAVRRLSEGSSVVGSIVDESRQSSYYRAMSKYLPPPVGSDLVCLLSD